MEDMATHKLNLDMQYDLEADALVAIKNHLTLLGIFWMREESTQRGRSDLICCYNGRFIAIEVKSKTGKPSHHQKRFIQCVQAAGGKAGICRSIADVLRLIYL